MRRVALVFGCNGNDSIGKLTYAENDAFQMGKVFSERCKCEVISIPPEVSRKDFQEQLYSVTESLATDDALFVYFSGHGHISRQSLFFVTKQFDREKVQSSGIPASIVVDAIRFSKASNKVLILDCCNAGGAISGLKSSQLEVGQIVPEVESIAYLFASERFEVTREKEEWQGSFLRYAMEKALRNTSSAITIESLSNELRQIADNYNSSAPLGENIAIPFVRAQFNGQFYIADAVEEGPSRFQNSKEVFVSITFDDLFRMNSGRFLKGIHDFADWSQESLSRSLPVRILLPRELDEQREVWKSYREGASLPNLQAVRSEVAQNTNYLETRWRANELALVDTIRDVFSELKSIAGGKEHEQANWLKDFARLMAESYVFTVIRGLLSYRLGNEEEPKWMERFRRLNRPFSSQSISAIAPVWDDHFAGVNESIYWTDFNAYSRNNYLPTTKLYFPVTIQDIAVAVDERLNLKQSRALLGGVQIYLEQHFRGQKPSLHTLYWSLFHNNIYFLERGESYVSALSYNSPDANLPTLQRIAKEAAQIIREKGQGVSQYGFRVSGGIGPLLNQEMGLNAERSFN